MQQLTIKQAVQHLKRGLLSAHDLCQRCINRINKLKDLNAFITFTPELALQQTSNIQSKLEKGGYVGQLTGIPVAVKDNFSMSQVKTTCGSQSLFNYYPPYNATVVQKLEDHGAVLMGKTNLDEFGMGCGTVDSISGATKNPWKYTFVTGEQLGYSSYHTFDRNKWHITGGSSGGSAVAVATGMVWAALGSDTGGSTRNPASQCGVIGLKPTYGRVSRHGLIPLVNSMDVPGILTRCVDDAATLLNVLSGHDLFDSTTASNVNATIEVADDVSVKGLHVGIPKEYHAPGTSPETLSVWKDVADRFEKAGAQVTSVSLPHTEHSIACYHVLCACEVASNMARYDGIEFGFRACEDTSIEALYAYSRHEGFNEVVRGRILAGNYFLLRSEHYEKYYMQALRVRRLIAEDFENVFRSGVNVLLTPTVLGVAMPAYEFLQADSRTRTQEQDVFTQPVNLAGVPAVVVPVALSSSGLPIGLQVIGNMFDEKTILHAAKWIEQQMSFRYLNLDWLDN